MKKIFFILLVFPFLAQATPKAVIMIRHAEEPEKDETFLSKTGQERARRLPKIFKDNVKLKKLGLPVALFAAGAKHEDSSVRSIQTLHFLSQSLKIQINDSYMRDDIKDLAEEILDNDEYNDKVVLVCWQHKLMTYIAEELGMKKGPEYPSGKFDRIWILNFEKDKKDKKPKIKFEDLPQHIMPGDSTK